VSFGQTRAVGAVKFEFEIPIGSLTGDPAVYGAVVEALADGPRSYSDLARLPPFAKDDQGMLMKVVGLLISAGAIHPLAPGAGAGNGGQGFNRFLLQRVTPENAPTNLAAPAIGAGVWAEFIDLLGLSAARPKGIDRQAVARQSWEMMSASGARLTKDGETLASQAAHEAEMVSLLEAFETEKLPFYRRLGVI
jgi:hypothetical protein